MKFLLTSREVVHEIFTYIKGRCSWKLFVCGQNSLISPILKLVSCLFWWFDSLIYECKKYLLWIFSSFDLVSNFLPHLTTLQFVLPYLTLLQTFNTPLDLVVVCFSPLNLVADGFTSFDLDAVFLSIWQCCHFSNPIKNHCIVCFTPLDLVAPPLFFFIKLDLVAPFFYPSWPCYTPFFYPT